MRIPATANGERAESKRAGASLLDDLTRAAQMLWRKASRLTHREQRSLRLCESLSLGDRRFLAVVEYESTRFLVGGTSGSLVLLTKLEAVANHATGDTSYRDPANKEART